MITMRPPEVESPGAGGRIWVGGKCSKPFCDIQPPPLIFLWRRPTITLSRPQHEPPPSLDRGALTAAGLAYLDGGLSIIPVGSRKKPAIPEWAPFQEKQATREQVKGWGKKNFVVGFAVVCGAVSGGLTILDFDVAGFYERWAALAGELAQILPTQRTGGGGEQVAFRSGLVVANDKLAWAPANNQVGREIAIETRGEGGYAVLPPSFCQLATKRGNRHRHPYQGIQGDFANVPTIPTEQARRLIEVARSLCQAPVSKKQMQSAPLSPRSNSGQAGGGVIGRFNEVYGVGTILSRNDYQLRGDRYLAPDSTTGEPGVHIFEDTGRCYSHHGNDPLNDGHAHNSFSVFCILEHGGDVKAAVKAAAAELGIERTPVRLQAPAADTQDYDPQERESILEEPQATEMDTYNRELPPDWRGPQAPGPGKGSEPPQKKTSLKTFTARELGTKEFPPQRWAIPDLIPEGLTILGGRPKIGKSWFALNLAVAGATGGMALAKIQVEQGEVLYLALEDTPRRLKERLAIIIPFGDLPDTLHFHTAINFPQTFKEALDALSSWLEAHPQASIVVIDTLARIKPAKGRNADSYDHDSQVMAALQKLSALHRIALIVVAHTKKASEDDFLSNVLGSSGLTGVADCIVELTRKARGQLDGTLNLTGRDIEETSLGLKFHPEEGAWELMGPADEYEKSQQRLAIIKTIRENGPMTPKEIAEAMGENHPKIKSLLWKMRKEEELVSRAGKYEIIK